MLCCLVQANISLKHGRVKSDIREKKQKSYPSITQKSPKIVYKSPNFSLLRKSVSFLGNLILISSYPGWFGLEFDCTILLLTRLLTVLGFHHRQRLNLTVEISRIFAR